MLDKFNSILLAADNLINNIDYDVRMAVIATFSVLMTLAGIAIIVIIMLQKGTNDNVGVITGATDTFYGKNKEHSRESNLKKATFALFALIIVFAIIVVVMSLAD